MGKERCYSCGTDKEPLQKCSDFIICKRCLESKNVQEHRLNPFNKP